MFLNYIKEFILKKIVKKKLLNNKAVINDEKISSVGLLLDEEQFSVLNQLITELVNVGISRNQIEILGFKGKINKNESFDFPVFCYQNITLNGVIENSYVSDFINRPFELLINFYKSEKAALMKVSVISKAKFKVGFGSVDTRVNDFIIHTDSADYKVFLNELFKYLKILNKL